MGCRREGRGPPASGSKPWGRKRGAWGLARTGPRGPRVAWVLRSPSAWRRGGEHHRGEDPSRETVKAIRWGVEEGRERSRALGVGEGASATHPGRGGQPQRDCGQQGERSQRGLLQPQPLAQERLPWEQGRGHRSQTSTPGHAFPRTPRRLRWGLPRPCGPSLVGRLLRGASELPPRAQPGKALPRSPGPGWGRARCHWGSCTLTPACCYYWGRSLRVGERGTRSQGPGGGARRRGQEQTPSPSGRALLPAFFPAGRAEGRPPPVSSAFGHLFV